MAAPSSADATTPATTASDGTPLDELLFIDAIDVGGDASFAKRMYAACFAVLAIGALVYAVVAAIAWASGLASPFFELAHVSSAIVWSGALVAASLAMLIVHELVHGALFKHFAPAGARITFGCNLKAGVLYAKAEGIVFTAREYHIIAFGPTIVVTGALIVIGACLRWPLWTLAIATLHLSGCVGDWGFMLHMHRDTRITHAQDTGDGARFYQHVGAGSEE